MFDILFDGFPAIPQQVSQAEESGYPEAAAAVGEKSELRSLHRAHAGGEGAEVPNSGNEIAESQPPVAHAREPGVCLVDVVFGDADVTPIFMDHFHAEGAAQG